MNSPYSAPVGGDTAANNSRSVYARNSVLRSPVDSFNRSINTPLVSPLVPICEEELLASAQLDEEDERAAAFVAKSPRSKSKKATSPRRAPFMSKEEFSSKAVEEAAGDSLAEKIVSSKEPPGSEIKKSSRPPAALTSTTSLTTFKVRFLGIKNHIFVSLSTYNYKRKKVKETV